MECSERVSRFISIPLNTNGTIEPILPNTTPTFSPSFSLLYTTLILPYRPSRRSLHLRLPAHFPKFSSRYGSECSILILVLG